MKLFLILAWRNLWRNKRRTLLSVSSVFFALLLAIITGSLQNGSYDYMIDSAVRMYTGYLQIHGQNYWEERSLESSIDYNESLLAKIESQNSIRIAVPRLENFMLVSSGNLTKVGSIIGIDPKKEDKMSSLKSKVISGEYIDEDDDALLISEGLARLLDVEIGDSIILYGQGIYGTTAAGIFPIKGIVKFSLPELNNRMVYLPLKLSQQLLSLENKVTSISILLTNPKELGTVQKNLKKILGNNYEIMTWEEMMPELVQIIQLDSVSGIIMLAILYIIITFGIFGTIMMMTAERTREFGILISIGMKKTRLIIVTAIESLLISLLGILSSLLVTIPMILYFNKNPIRLKGNLEEISLKYGVEPILPFNKDIDLFINQTIVVLIIGIVCALYPLLYIRKLNPVQALRQ